MKKYKFIVTAGNHGAYDEAGNPLKFGPGDEILLTYAEAATKPWAKPAPGTPTPPAAPEAEPEATKKESKKVPAPSDAGGFGDWAGFLDAHNVTDTRAQIEQLADAEQVAALLTAEESRENPRKGVVYAAEDRLRALGVSGDGGAGGEEA
jgi:hypothetical protein